MLDFLQVDSYLADAEAAVTRLVGALEGAYPEAWDGTAADAYYEQLVEAIAAAYRLRTRIGYARQAVA